MWVWLILGLLIGGFAGAAANYLLRDHREDLLFRETLRKLVQTDLENFDLRIEIADLKIELEDERYRHDRVQDFCVAQGEQLDAAKRDLKHSGACFTCGNNGVSCHVEQLIVEGDARCGSYRWRGASKNDGRQCRSAPAEETDGVAAAAYAQAGNDRACRVTDG